MIELDELKRRIKEARDSYWQLGISSMSDEEYDRLVEELRERTGEYDPVCAPEVLSSGKVRHPQEHPMLSMQKVYKASDVAAWVKKIGDPIMLHVMPKYDGIALRRYATGVIATRGSGSVGENVTETARIFVERSRAARTAFVDGEAICLRSTFEDLARLGYKNPRNAVSGILASKDADIRARATSLTFVPYKSFVWQLNYDSSSGKFLAELNDAVARIKGSMSNYPMDGIVFRVANPRLFRELGHTDHHWRGQIALKFKGGQAQTTILRIDWQVKNGTVTPVALLQSVELDGARIERVTLHNADYVMANAVCEGDVVVVERAGGVIPSVVRVLHGQKIGWPVIPKECPVCHSQLLRSGARLYCAVCEAKGDKE